MCIFRSSVVNVAKTNIFVAACDDSTRQITVYQNVVKSTKENAMILPVPLTGSADDIELLDLKAEKDFFKDMYNLFPLEESEAEDDRPKAKAKGKGKAMLPVYKVGDYDVTIVPDTDSFNQVDDDAFTLNKRIVGMLMYLYPENFAFLVCKFGGDSKEKHMHPLGYIHDRVDGANLFVPTVHIHDGEMHAEEHFDHRIYSFNTSMDNKADAGDETLQKMYDTYTFLQRLDVQSHADLNNLYLYEIEGSHENKDIRMQVIGNTPKKVVKQAAKKGKGKTKIAKGKVAKH